MTLSQVRLVKGVWLFASPTLLSFFPPWDTTQEILTQHERVHLGTSDQAVVQKWFAALSATWTSLDGWRLVQCLNSGDWKSISCRSRHVSCSSLGWLKDEADDIYIYIIHYSYTVFLMNMGFLCTMDQVPTNEQYFPHNHRAVEVSGCCSCGFQITPAPLGTRFLLNNGRLVPHTQHWHQVHGVGVGWIGHRHDFSVQWFNHVKIPSIPHIIMCHMDV